MINFFKIKLKRLRVFIYKAVSIENFKFEKAEAGFYVQSLV